MKRLKVPMNLQKNLKITQRVPKKSLLILIGEQSNRKWMSTILFHPIEKLMIVSVRTLKKPITPMPIGVLLLRTLFFLILRKFLCLPPSMLNVCFDDISIEKVLEHCLVILLFSNLCLLLSKTQHSSDKRSNIQIYNIFEPPPPKFE